MSDTRSPSFSRTRRLSLSLSAILALMAVTALVVMANYLAARHFTRWSWSRVAQGPLSPLTLRVLESTTNDVKVTVYFDKREPLYEMVVDLLKTYCNASRRVTYTLVDYISDPGAAQLVKTRYNLNASTDRDLIIFDCQGRRGTVNASELSEYDLQPLITMQSQEVRRTHFKGELLFTSALLKVITPRPLKAYFLQGHGEHSPDLTDKVLGYSQFAEVLRENTVAIEKLSLEGPTEVPADCDLLIIAGPRTAMRPEVLDKVDRYLKQGKRLLALLSNDGVYRPSGLERMLENWGVTVGRNIVFDDTSTMTERDVVVAHFGGHPLIKPFHGSRLYLLLPRSVGKHQSSGADAPQVDILATTGPAGRIVTDIRADGQIRRLPSDFIGEVPLMAAVEKGGIRNVSAAQGATRLVVVGDSYFLGNEIIDNAGNRQFATHAVNWLLARDDFLVAIPPKPIKEYKVTMTQSQMSAAQWILLGAFPGSVLFVGWLVWLRRRR